MNMIEQIKRLAALGWKLHSGTELAFHDLRKLYAAFHGLSSMDDIVNHLQLPRFCNHPDAMQAQGFMCKWPDPLITWDVITPLAAFDKQKYVELATEAFSRWAKVCGITPQYTPGNPHARILMSVKSIDGPYGILAESELPCGAVQCNQWFDTSESWAAFDGPPPANVTALDIVRVMTHELGHALGMNHIGAGNLLAPVYDNNVYTPQAGDVKEMQVRYGPPIPTQPTPQPPTPTPSGDYVIRLTGGVLEIDGYRLTKLLTI